jgi:hypothetical protein
MSVNCSNTPEPKILNSLAALSLTLDEAASAPQPSLFAVFSDRGRGAREKPRRRSLLDYWPVAVVAGCTLGIWAVLCGGYLRYAASQSPTYQDEPMAFVEGDLPLAPVHSGGIPDHGKTGPPPANGLGTRVSFVNSVAEASQKAHDQHRLLMILNVSGDFEDAQFT